MPGADGEAQTATWVTLHNQVRVVSTTGETREGFLFGPHWLGPAEVAEVILTVDPDEGESLTLPIDEVASVTPVEEHSARGLLRAVSEAVAQHRTLPMEEERYFRWVVDSHTTLDVTVRKARHQCLPGPNPYG